MQGPDSLVQQIHRMTHDFGQCSIEMRESLGGRGESHRRAKVVSPNLAIFARLAIDAHFERHPVADLQIAPGWQGRREGRDDSARFVAQDHGGLDLEDSVRAVRVVVH